MKMKQRYYKFVTRELTDHYSGEMDYSRVGVWLHCPDVREGDCNGEPCGRGLHLMKIPNPMYCQYAIGYLAEGRKLLGEDEEKARFAEIRLIRPLKFSEIFFEGADLRYANLRGADLRYANLWGANLRYADLRYANLRDADLRYADLWGADLRYADLRYADLQGANLRDAQLEAIARQV